MLTLKFKTKKDKGTTFVDRWESHHDGNETNLSRETQREAVADLVEGMVIIHLVI